ncbi:hypothetical protein DWF00_26865 [Bosea caraganae]|uniref:Uncharacterized protein n=1 Tax=Bosea caraganae TaxID=2763117 RepID=A0A370L9N2_9HYPH|nr:hypothetical protein DWF00_26865 [Bosea caraganae]RDJ28017.1 hypothetical protein DWE98_05290 [Bosea caraganae]
MRIGRIIRREGRPASGAGSHFGVRDFWRGRRRHASAPTWSLRHCEERSDEAIQGPSSETSGLLRCARNDGERHCNRSSPAL